MVKFAGEKASPRESVHLWEEGVRPTITVQGLFVPDWCDLTGWQNHDPCDFLTPQCETSVLRVGAANLNPQKPSTSSVIQPMGVGKLGAESFG